VGDPVRINTPESYRLGLELQAGYRINKKLQLAGNLTFSRNKILHYYDNIPAYDADFNLVDQYTLYYKETNMALSPEVVGAATVQFNPFKNAEISFINKYVSKQFLDNSSDERRKIAPYYAADIRASYLLEKLLGKEISLIVQVNNLWNKKYQSNGYTYSYLYNKATVTENFYFPMAGRNILAGLNVKF
jgi:iron complex outermembrane receptor protein